MKKLLIILLMLGCYQLVSFAANPVIINKGVNDPHIRIFDGKAYLSATHDKSAGNTRFTTDVWWLWSSEDLVEWKLEYTLKPEETYIGKPYDGCWATDITKRNGKYYWYFSERNEQTGVMVADSPSGPWTDPLGKPLLDRDLTPTQEYDPGIFQDKSGDFYIVFGVWDFYLAKLNEDMISLAEKPRKITLNNPRGPYNPDGLNVNSPTDDKPFLHYYKGKYYLSWGCFYAMADNVYGPYDYKGSVIEKESFAPGYDAPTWPKGFKQGRHGSFFEWHNQWYFSYCDISQTGNRFFRDTFISYLHYRENGEMAIIRVDGTGVGEYDATDGKIEAEDYFKASGNKTIEIKNDGFVVSEMQKNNFLIYPNIKGLKGKKRIEFRFVSTGPVSIEIRNGSPESELIGRYHVKGKKPHPGFRNFACNIPEMSDKQSICLIFGGKGLKSLQMDSFLFK